MQVIKSSIPKIFSLALLVSFIFSTTVYATSTQSNLFPFTTLHPLAVSTTPSYTDVVIELTINSEYMYVNSVKKEIDPGRATKPIIVNNRTLVPIRAIVEAFGGSIGWNQNLQKVTININSKIIELVIGSKTAIVNGQSQTMDVAPMINNSRTMLPVRFINETIGNVVLWEGNTQKVTLMTRTYAKSLIDTVAAETISALKNHDMDTLSTKVHPVKGVRFSPYSYISLTNDLVFQANQINNSLFSSNYLYVWGEFDGTGDPINFTFNQYFNRFIYDRDFINAPNIGYNQIIGTGNMINNIFSAYPNALFVEYHFPGFDPIFNGMDWRSLRLVFENYNGIWYLVGIVHDEWTI